MLSHKIKITLILAIIFSVSVISVTQAAPPLQGRSGTSQGHTLNLDAEGNNLGTVMKGSNAKGSVSNNDGQNPVATALANYFDGTSYEDIMALHESGVGYGNIAKALFFSSKFDLGMGAADLLAEAGQSGWGKTLRDNGIHPGSIGKGRGNQPEHAGAKANNGQDNGNGNNGQGNGKGKGKNKGDTDGSDSDVDSDDDDDANTDANSDDDDDAADSDDDDDNGNGNGNGRGKGKGNNGQGNGKGQNNATNLDDDSDTGSDDAADSDDDDDNGNGNGQDNGKNKGNNGKGNGKGNGNGNNGQSK